MGLPKEIITAQAAAQHLSQPCLLSQVAPPDLKRNKIRSVPEMRTEMTIGKGEFANKLKYVELLIVPLKYCWEKRSHHAVDIPCSIYHF